MTKRKNIDLTFKTFGKLYVWSLAIKHGHNRLWVCQCDCGKDIRVRQYNLLSGKTTHCGCERTYIKKPKVMPEVKLSLIQRISAKIKNWF